MKTILILYIVAINLIGFFIMGIDKRKAKRRKWRVPEKTLFLIALLFGSVGVLVGMYVFRHKTRHLSFTLGIPVILVVQLLLIGLLYSWNVKRMGSPSLAVQNELDLIQKLDSDTIQTFVSYENLMNSHLASGTIDEDATKAVALFFEHFSYRIEKEEITDDQATVSVTITNIDTHALAQDLCTEILKNSVTIYPASDPSTTSDYYRLLGDTLSSNTYDLTVTTAYFHLIKDESGWVILSDETLEDELVSGFISYMNDPKILPASTVLALHLDALKELDAEQWMDYLSIEDVFATYNADYYQQIDQEYVTQLANSFDYEILRCTEDGDTATAAIRIISVDMTNVLTIYKRHLLAYAATTQSIRDNDVQFSNETASLLLQSLQENSETAATDIDLTFRNNGDTWEIYFDEEFSNALMGDIAGAIRTFNSITRDTQDM